VSDEGKNSVRIGTVYSWWANALAQLGGRWDSTYQGREHGDLFMGYWFFEV
jgi:hypothetical protein